MARRAKTRAALTQEVTDLEADSGQGSGLTLEAGLIFATFLGLLVGVVLSQFALAKYFDAGLLG